MLIKRIHHVATIAFAAIVATTSLRADGPASANESHIRATTPALQALVDESGERSPAFRALVEQINASDVVVYLKYYLFSPAGPDGRLIFVGTAGGRRYVMVQIGCLHTRVDEFAILAHELQHAAEVAAAPSIVDAASLAQHYATIGFVARQWQHGIAFETGAAKEAGSLVQQEIIESIRAEEAAARASHASAATARN